MEDRDKVLEYRAKGVSATVYSDGSFIYEPARHSFLEGTLEGELSETETSELVETAFEVLSEQSDSSLWSRMDERLGVRKLRAMEDELSWAFSKPTGLERLGAELQQYVYRNGRVSR